MKKKFLDFLRRLSWKNFLGLTVAGIINAIGVTVFIAPVQLYDSGISGTSILLSQLTPPELSLSVFLILLNIPLFLYGLRRQGAIFTVYAIYSVAVYSTVAWLITDVLPVDVSVASPLAGQDLLLKRDRQFFQQIFEFRISVPAGGEIPCRKTVVPVVPGKNKHIAPALLFGKLQRVPDSAEKAEYHGIIFFIRKNVVNTATPGNHIGDLVSLAII